MVVCAYLESVSPLKRQQNQGVLTLIGEWAKVGFMTLTIEQFDRIKGCLTVQRGNVKTDNFTFVRALLYVAGNGCR
jgi:hypothetical protein